MGLRPAGTWVGVSGPLVTRVLLHRAGRGDMRQQRHCTVWDLMLGTPWGPQLKDRIGDIICCRVVHIVAKEPTILFQFPIRHNFSLPPSQAPTGAATFAARGGTRMAAGSPLAAARVGGPGKVIGIASTERFRKPTVSSFTLEENEANFNPLGQPKTMCVTN